MSPAPKESSFLFFDQSACPQKAHAKEDAPVLPVRAILSLSRMVWLCYSRGVFTGPLRAFEIAPDRAKREIVTGGYDFAEAQVWGQLLRLDIAKGVVIAFIRTMRAAAVMFFGATSVFAQQENADWCENRGHVVGTDQQIDACTAIILRGEWPGRSLTLAFFTRANGYSAKGDYDRAIADHTKAIALDPKYVEAYNGRGYAYAVKGDLDRAIADYSRVIELDPKLASAYLNRGAAYVGKGEFDRAIADLDKAIELDPRVAAAYANRGATYTYKGVKAGAIIPH